MDSDRVVTGRLSKSPPLLRVMPRHPAMSWGGALKADVDSVKIDSKVVQMFSCWFCSTKMCGALVN